MQKVQISKISKEIQSFIENLTYNGLNLISNENIRQIEFFLQNASQVEAFRLATSLRYLHVELKRFLNQSPAFNIDRYVFFLSNCWLLSRAFSFRKDKLDDDFYDQLVGKAPHYDIIANLELSLAGIEKIYLEGTIFGLILYFLSLKGKTKGQILKWNLLQPPRGVINPEILLAIEIPQHKISFKELLFKSCTATNLSFSEKDELITYNKEKNSKIRVIEKEQEFPLDFLEKFNHSSSELYKKLSNFNYTPFDLPASIFDYLLLKNVEVVESEIEGDEGNTTSIPVNVFHLEHANGYPVHIRIQDKSINQVLIDKFNEYKKKKTKIDNVFGKILLERGQLSIFPLSMIHEDKIDFICISDLTQDYRDIMKSLYKK